ncbi:MAG: hypothetical protein HYT22_01580 [Candidatus Niyogibacteria bacterium]|nr:hypothetical protein [Candidatus Niyogibacteria bacterium]
MAENERSCQNCKKEFAIEIADLDFYRAMDVPPPTFCPACRFQRRLSFLNVMTLYKRKCDLCGVEKLSIFSPDKPFVVYCPPCWFSDRWDAMDHAREYDPSKNFFEQLGELQKKVPTLGLFGNYPTLVNSPYNNYVYALKNCYFLFDSGNAENCHYSLMLKDSKDSMDCSVVEGNERCYENIVADKSYNVHFSEDFAECRNVYFSKHVKSCTDCFGCVNLRHKQYHIFNEPYSKSDYEKKIKEFRLDSFRELEKMKERAAAFWLRFPQKFMHGSHNVDVSGEYIYFSKNAHDCYMVDEVEDSRWVQLTIFDGAKRCYDYTSGGFNAEYNYEHISGAASNRVRFSFGADDSLNADYSMDLISCQDMLGCIGLRKKSYCILNKQYGKEDYQKLRSVILDDLKKNPYRDRAGRVFGYGEFFPYDLSYFDYNETQAQDFFPLARTDIEAREWRWKEPVGKEHTITLNALDLPDAIGDVPDTITSEVIECRACRRAYHIISAELALLREFGFALPRECFWCRNARRFSRLNPPRFHQRACMKCGKEITTAYDPSRPDIVYCEECYLAEVA